MPEPTPEAWAQIRHDYEHTSRPVAGICAEHSITEPMLRYRVKRWGWQKRRSLIPVQGPPPAPAPPPVMAEAAKDLGLAPAVDAARAALPPVPEAQEDGTAIVPRLQSAVTRLLPAIESVIAQIASGPHSPHAMAQAARALGTLTRTLRELNALLAQYNAQPAATCRCCEYDDMPEDLDAFREALAKRIDAWCASEMAAEAAKAQRDAGEAKPGETC